jgi:DNA-binding Xre family transcriptional regulator
MKPRMIIIKLREVLDQQGQTMYWLAKTAGVPHNTLRNIASKDSQKRIDLTVLSKLCAALECLPGEFFEFAPDDEDRAITALARSKKAKDAGAGKVAKKKKKSGVVGAR